MPGCFYIQSGSKALLAGAPPEVSKVMVKRRLAAPNAILLPDQPVRHGQTPGDY